MKLNWAWTAAKIFFCKSVISKRNNRTRAAQPSMQDALMSLCPSHGANKTNDIEIILKNLDVMQGKPILWYVDSLTEIIRKFSFLHNSFPQSEFTQQTRLRFILKLWPSWSAPQTLQSIKYSYEHFQLPLPPDPLLFRCIVKGPAKSFSLKHQN